MSDSAARRPGLVTVVAVLTVVAGVLSLLAGFVWLFLPTDTASSDLAWRLVGAGYVLCGIAMLVVARGLLRGDPRARVAFVGLLVLNAVLVAVGSTASNGSSKGLSFLDLVVILIGVVMVFTPKANAFFRRSRVPSTV